MYKFLSKNLLHIQNNIQQDEISFDPPASNTLIKKEAKKTSAINGITNTDETSIISKFKLNELDIKNESFSILDAIEKLNLVKSRSETKRLIKSDGIKVNDKIYKNSDLSLKEYSTLKEIKIAVGKKKIGILKII